jgi:hypothetical protein
MAMVFDRVDAVANRAHTDDGTMLFVWLAIEGLQPRPFGFSPSVAVDLLAAIHFVSQQAEIARDRLAAQGHAFPHTFITVQTAETLETFEPDKIGVRIFFRDNSGLDLALSADTARALRDRLDDALSLAEESSKSSH